jgi:hypothetical protein
VCCGNTPRAGPLLPFQTFTWLCVRETIIVLMDLEIERGRGTRGTILRRGQEHMLWRDGAACGVVDCGHQFAI